jgi:hypothetical protein
MKLRKYITILTILAIRTTVRFAWAIARAARVLEAFGERIEGAVDRRTAGWQVDPADVLEPLIDEHYAA